MTAPRLESRLAALVAQRYDGDETEAQEVLQSTLRRLAWRRNRGFKVCEVCRESKRVQAFGQESRNRDGLSRRCSSCERRRKAQQRLGLVP